MDPVHVIPGLHATRDALLSENPQIREIWIREGKKGPRVTEIVRIAESRSISVRFMGRAELDHRLPGVNHQGIAAIAGKFAYTSFEDLIARALRAKGHALLMAADHITDEGNLGAMIRTGAFFGAHGLILPRKRSAAMTSRVIKTSSGGHVHLPVSQVVNMVRALDLLERQAFWIIGTAPDGIDSIYEFDWLRNVILVFGSEGRGLSRLVRTRCHQLVRIPSCGRLDSLNVSVAAGIVLSEIARRRTGASEPSGAYTF
jgi:23S rRNA (guanosine2251-2'-O)-methyltransferase